MFFFGTYVALLVVFLVGVSLTLFDNLKDKWDAR